ncbi:MAG: hypothetical protein ACTHWA_03020 [Arachnia sp.]
MTALMGLRTRLALAKVAVLVEGESLAFETLTSFVDAGADLLILGGTGDVDADVEVMRSMRNAWGSSPLLMGTAMKGVAAPAAVDVVHLKRPGWRFFGYPQGHAWSLLGRHATEDAVLESPGTAFDYLFVPLSRPKRRLLVSALEHQPPLTPGALPWFALGDHDLATVEDLLAAGVRRIALTGDALHRSDAQKRIVSVVDAVARTWSADERSHSYRAAALRL